MIGLRNQNGENVENLCETSILEIQVIFPISAYDIRLDITLFPVKSTNGIKIKITHHRV